MVQQENGKVCILLAIARMVIDFNITEEDTGCSSG
jgi:hypothetical protein